MKKSRLMGVVCAVLIAPASMVIQSSHASTFSVENVSFDVAGGTPPGNDILSPGGLPVGTPPGLVIPGVAGVGVEVDGFTYGRNSRFNEQTAIIEFSVDAFSLGTPGSGVAFEAGFAPGEQNYDVYRADIATAPGTNAQIHDGDGAGPGGVISPLGMSEPQMALPNPIHPGVDGYDSRSIPGNFIYWSWESPIGSAPPGPTVSGADVMISPAAPGYDGVGAVFATSMALGLDMIVGAGPDDIDALEVFDLGAPGRFDPGLDLILFSLEPGSPSLLASGLSPGDVLFSTGGGSFGLAISAGALGLTPQDNLTALSAIPLPPAFWLLGSSLLALMTIARRKKSV